MEHDLLLLPGDPALAALDDLFPPPPPTDRALWPLRADAPRFDDLHIGNASPASAISAVAFAPPDALPDFSDLAPHLACPLLKPEAILLHHQDDDEDADFPFDPTPLPPHVFGSSDHVHADSAMPLSPPPPLPPPPTPSFATPPMCAVDMGAPVKVEARLDSASADATQDTMAADDGMLLLDSPCFGETSHMSDRSSLSRSRRKGFAKPPTTARIRLEDLKKVFHLERPKAEKFLSLKRTTFSNLSRHFGISKWPYRTIRDVEKRREANNVMLHNGGISKEKRRKLIEQQRNLVGVVKLIYEDPTESRDSNTLAVLLKMVDSRRNGSKFC